VRRFGKILQIIGFAGVVIHALLILMVLYRLWIMDLAIQPGVEQYRYFGCCRRIYINNIFGAGIWAILFSIILAAGLLMERLGNRSNK